MANATGRQRASMNTASSADIGKIQENKDSRPVPDPTVQTSQQLQREALILRELIDLRVGALEKIVEKLQEAVAQAPTVAVVAQMAKALKELHEEKFDSIATQFKERDTRTDQTSRDSKVAVDAALQAAKEAVSEQNKSSAIAIAKSEASTTKQVDQLGTLIQTATKSLEDKITDLKDRVTANEGRTLGITHAEKRGGDWVGNVVGMIGMAVAIITLMLVIFRLK